MSGTNYYILSALPSLDALTTPPPIECGELLDKVESNPSALAALRALLLSDDLMIRQAILTGELETAEPVVLSAAQIRDEEPLPMYLQIVTDVSATRLPEDILWSAYFFWVDKVAYKEGNNFLKAWVGFEVALRNQLAQLRAKTLNLEAADFIVAEELAGVNVDCSGLLAEWSAAADPLTGLDVLDRGRWNWITENEAWFSFKNDELAVYGAKLMLMQRHQRLTQRTAVAGSH
ncbi:MAG: DUF2764 family protein [Sedimentisphaerales bacterium]|nr:DUF2764 family protein [Sedimentisphaerales bacterium]